MYKLIEKAKLMRDLIKNTPFNNFFEEKRMNGTLRSVLL